MSRGGWGGSGSCSCGVRRRMKESPKRLHGRKGWLQVSRTRSHFFPTVSSEKSTVGNSSWGEWGTALTQHCHYLCLLLCQQDIWGIMGTREAGKQS